MANVFVDFISKVNEFQEAKNEMKWWDRINPFTRRKIKRVEQRLEEYIDNIVSSKITKEFLYDFQRAVWSFHDVHDTEIVQIAYDDIAREISIFFHTILRLDEFDYITIDIVGDTMKFSCAAGSLACGPELPEELGPLHATIAEKLRYGIQLYLESWLEYKN